MLTTLPSEKKWIRRCDVWSRTKSTSRSLGAARGVQWTFSIHSAYLRKSQSENKKLSWSVRIHNKTPHVVTVLWLDSDDVVTILSSTRNLVEGYKTVYLCHLDSYTVTVCNGYLVSSHKVTVQLPTRCLVDRFLHRPHGSGYLITCVPDVVTVQ